MHFISTYVHTQTYTHIHIATHTPRIHTYTHTHTWKSVRASTTRPNALESKLIECVAAALLPALGGCLLGVEREWCRCCGVSDSC